MLLKSLSCLMLVLLLNACGDIKQHDTLPLDLSEINLTLDSLHDAASKAQKDRYLGLFTQNGVFMGTDDWERWPRPTELDAYVSERFKDGKGWRYHAIERHINFSAEGNVAWFDEITESEKWGKFRGTGVLVKQGERWKIAHYAMSFLVPNEVWEPVSELSKKAFDLRSAE